MEQQKVIIIGAGIAGLTAGISLEKMGFKVAVYEAHSKIQGIGAGLGLASNAIKALDYLDLSEGIAAIGTHVTASHIRDSKGKTIAIADARLTAAFDNRNYAIHRKDLHDYLFSKIREGCVFSHKKLTHFTQTETEVFVEFADGTSDTAHFLIAADGVGSFIRQQLNPHAIPRYAGYTCWRGIIQNPNLTLTDSSETWGAQGRFGHVSLPNHLIYWYACINTTHAEVRQYSLEDLRANFKDYYQPIPSILNHTDIAQVLQHDILDIKPLKQFAYNRILLIGDAAHATTPNMGQGACMALEDVAVLIYTLRQEPNVTEAFKLFEKKRLKRTSYIIRTSKNMGKVAQLENPLLIKIRNGLFRNMPKWFVKRQMSILLDTDIYQL